MAHKPMYSRPQGWTRSSCSAPAMDCELTYETGESGWTESHKTRPNSLRTAAGSGLWHLKNVTQTNSSAFQWQYCVVCMYMCPCEGRREGGRTWSAGRTDTQRLTANSMGVIQTTLRRRALRLSLRGLMGLRLEGRLWLITGFYRCLPLV